MSTEMDVCSVIDGVFYHVVGYMDMSIPKQDACNLLAWLSSLHSPIVHPRWTLL